MKAEIQYGKIITTQNVIDWELTPSKVEREVSLFTTKDTLIKDLIDSLTPINKGDTKKLEICVQLDAQDRIRIVRRWAVKPL